MKTTPEISFSRVQKRAREGEIIPIEYLDRCNKYHDMWLDNIPSEKKIIIDGNTDIEESPDIILTWMSTIHKWMIGEIYKKMRGQYKEDRMPLNFVV